MNSLAQDYIEYILEQARQNENKKNKNTQQNQQTPGSKLNMYGDRLNNVGQFAKDHFQSNFGQKVGNGLTNVGGKLNNMGEALNNPGEMFQGFASKPFANPEVVNAVGEIGKLSANPLTSNTPIGNAVAENIAKDVAPQVASGLASNGATSIASGLGSGASAGAGASAGTAGASGASAGAGAGAMGGVVGAIIALAMKAHQSAKQAKKMSRNMLSMTNDLAKAGNEQAQNDLAQTQQFAEQMQNQEVGLPTGFATPILQTSQPNQNLPALDPNAGVGQAIPNFSSYNDTLKDYMVDSIARGVPVETVSGIPQGLNGGNKDIADWISQYNRGAEGQKAPINIPSSPEEVALAQKGEFNKPLEVGTESNRKLHLIDKLANGIADMSKGYQENKTTAFKPENLYSDDSKGKMQRLGEAFGSVNRMAQNPAMQALIAGGLSTAVTGSPMFGLSAFAKYGKAREDSQIYQKALKDLGVDVDYGTLGNVDKDMASELIKPKMEQKKLENTLAKIEEMKLYHQAMIDSRNRRNDSYDKKVEYDNANKQQKMYQDANKPTSKKLEDNVQYKQDMAELYDITMSGDMDKLAYAQKAFLQRYGKLPKFN